MMFGLLNNLFTKKTIYIVPPQLNLLILIEYFFIGSESKIYFTEE